MNNRNRVIALLAGLLVGSAALAFGGIVTASGTGTTKQDACTAAKSSAKSLATLDSAKSGKLSTVEVTGFSNCSCDTYPGYGTPPTTMWKCTVDATYTN